MTVREWFRVMRRADWERAPGTLLDVVTILNSGQLPSFVPHLRHVGGFPVWRAVRLETDSERKVRLVRELMDRALDDMERKLQDEEERLHRESRWFSDPMARRYTKE
jgi:hypothetical protein